MRFKAVIFDLDGTVADSNKYHFLSLKQAVEESTGYVPLEKEVLPSFGEPTATIVHELLSRNGLHADISKIVRKKQKLYRKMVWHKDLVSRENKAFLKRLKKKHYKIALASGSPRKTVLATLFKPEQRMFDVMVCFDDVLHAKPEPDELLLAAAKLNLHPSECLVVGDSLFDLLAAKRAGMKFAAKTGIVSKEKFKKHKPFKIVKKLKELESVLK